MQYSLLSSTAASHFAVDSDTGTVVLTAPLDYETTTEVRVLTAPLDYETTTEVRVMTVPLDYETTPEVRVLTAPQVYDTTAEVCVQKNVFYLHLLRSCCVHIFSLTHISNLFTLAELITARLTSVIYLLQLSS